MLKGGKKIHLSEFSLNESETKQLREAFNLFDKDGAGTISSIEVRVALRVLGFNMTDSETTALVNEYSKNHSNHIDFDEFTQIIIRKLSEPQPEAQLIRAFKMMDRDGDGFISLNDLSAVNEIIEDNLAVDELREVIMSARGKENQFDIHTKDVGKITQSEFIRAIYKIYGA